MQVLYLSVTLPAGNLAVDMALMVEEHMLCYVIYLYPGCRCLSIEISMLYLNPRVLGNDVVVTVQAFFNRRHSRVIRISYVWMAVLALYLFNAAVNIVAKRERLLGTEACLGPAVEKIN